MKGLLIKKPQISQLSCYDSLGALLVKKEKSVKDCEGIYQLIQRVQGFNGFIDSFLKGLSHNQVIHLCSKFEYKKYLKGDIIFRQGDDHDNRLYLILQGSVMIFINRDMDNEMESEKKHLLNNKDQQQLDLLEPESPVIQMSSLLAKIKGMSKNALSFITRKSKSGQVPYITPEEKEMLKKKYGNTTRSIGSGKYFGEKALLNNDKRSATIVVDQHLSEILTLEKKYFNEFLSGLLAILHSRKNTITQIFPEMNTYTLQKLDNMLYCFQPENYTKGNHLCIEGAKEDKILIVQEGEVQLEKCIKIEEEVRYNIKRKNIQIKVSILSSGGVVGEELFLNENYCYYYTCTVLSPKAIILVGDKKSIEVKFPNSIKQMFRGMWENKEKIRKEIIEQRRSEVETEAKNNQYRQEIKINLEKAQNFFVQHLKSQLAVKQITKRNQNIKEQRIGQISSSNDLQLKNQSLTVKSSNIPNFLDQNVTSQFDYSKEQLIQTMLKKNSNSTKNTESPRDNKPKQMDIAKISSPENFVYDFGNEYQKRFTPKLIKVNSVTEKPKIPQNGVDISKRIDQYVKNYKNNYLFSKDLNVSKLNQNSENNKDVQVSNENIKDLSDSSGTIQSNLKIQVIKEKNTEETESITVNNKQHRRGSKSIEDFTSVEILNNSLLKSLSLPKKQKSEKLIQLEQLSFRKISENSNELQTLSPIYNNKKDISNYSGDNTNFSEIKKSSFQIFKQLSKISSPKFVVQAKKVPSFLLSDQDFSKKSDSITDTNNLYQQNVLKYCSNTPSAVKILDICKTKIINQNNIDFNEALQAKQNSFTIKQSIRQHSLISLKQVQYPEEGQVYYQTSNEEVQKKKSFLGVSPTSSSHDKELPNLRQNSESSKQISSKQKKKSFQFQFHSQNVSPERSPSEKEKESQQSNLVSRKVSEHQKSLHFEDYQKEQKSLKSLSKLSNLSIQNLSKLPVKQKNKQNSISQMKLENIFLDSKNQKMNFYSPHNKMKNSLQEYGFHQKSETPKLNSYFYLEEINNHQNGVENLINLPTSASLIPQAPLKNPSLHNIRLKQFKDQKKSLNQKKASSLTKLNFSTPILEFIINTNKKSYEIQKQQQQQLPQ
ncbi:hypothetical protein ABPG72_016470 [Tetrahymena utriculariae]